MNDTIKLIGSQDPSYAQELIKSGTVKEIESGIAYLIIED
jgi:hypothetical protein